MKKLALLLAFSAITISPAHAGLVLELDPSNKTFALTGSDTGTTDNQFGIGVINFLGSGATENAGLIYDNDLAYETTLGVPGGFARDIEIALQGFSGDIYVNLQISTPGETTITGLGNFQSYASLGTEGISSFEGLIGTEMVPLSGADFGNLSVTQIPEPAHFAGIAGLLGLGLVLFLRRRRSTNLQS